MEAKVQFRISEKDQVLYDLWQDLKFEEQTTGLRGLVSNRMRDMIKAYCLISEHLGEDDPYKLMVKITSNLGKTGDSDRVV